MRHSVLSLLFLLILLPGCDATDVDDRPSNLNAPVPFAPSDDGVVPVGEAVLFQWTPVEEAQAYHVEIMQAGQPATRLALPVSQTGLTHVFEAAGAYTWRVCAADARGRTGYWSAYRQLAVVNGQ